MTSNSGLTRIGPYWFGESEDDFRESGMMNFWGSSTQKDRAVPYFDDDWSGHR